MSKIDHLSHQLADKIEVAEKILLIFGAQTSSLDQVAAATAFYTSLRGKYPQKTVTLLSIGEPMVEQIDLVGIQKAVTKLPVAGTVIALAKTSEQVEKVDCEMDEVSKNLRIIVKNMPNTPPLTSSEITLVPFSENYDVMVSFCGARTSLLKKMGVDNMAPDNTFLLNREKMVDNDAIDNIYPESGSYSGLIADLLRGWIWQVEVDVASNLLLGLDAKTHNFSSDKTNPILFELAGWLLRAGGQRLLAQTQKRREKVRQTRQN